MDYKYGKVYLAGAGPGDPELLTLKTKRLIETSDVIIYDHLLSEKILDLIPKEKEKIYAGKYSGMHILTQDKINKLLIKKAKEGKQILRLKGGDPYIFGRGGEEVEELINEGIDFEVVPGITSAIAVPTYAGIPLSYRNINSMILFITGHEDPKKKESDIDWEFISKFKGTIVILMGVKTLKKNCEKLIEYGMNKNTPISVIENGTKENQRVVFGTLETIAYNCEIKQIKPPSIIVIGDVVNKSKILSYKKSKLI